MQEDVGAFGVDVFGVDEEAVHVEDAGADGGKAGGLEVLVLVWRGYGHWRGRTGRWEQTYSGFEDVMVVASM